MALAFAHAQPSASYPSDSGPTYAAEAARRLAQPSTAAGVRGPGPVYRAAGRTSLPSRFCSRMCADQPAVRAEMNMVGIMYARDLGEVEYDRGPELDVRLDCPVRATLAQLA